MEKQFMGGPDQQAAQPHRRPDKDQQPKSADLSLAPKRVLKRQEGERRNQTELQKVTEQGKLKTFGKNQCRDQGE